MIIKIIDFYVINAQLMIGNEFDGNGQPTMARYVPLRHGVPNKLMISDNEESYIITANDISNEILSKE